MKQIILPLFSRVKQNNNLIYVLIFLILILFNCYLFSEDKTGLSFSSSNKRLLEQYIETKRPNVILFNSENIKQFWIDHSIIVQNDSIRIVLSPNGSTYKSIPLKIQLSNINESQDCLVEVITYDKTASFSVMDDKFKTISSQIQKKDFIDYQIIFSSFHLSDTHDLTFFLDFSSQKDSVLSVKSILLSFTSDKAKTIEIYDSDIFSSSSFSHKKDASSNAFSITGRSNMYILFNKDFLVSNNTLLHSINIKNTSHHPILVRVGYEARTKDGILIDNRITPYKKSNNIINIVSSKKNSNKLIVKSSNDILEWKEGCYIALNAKQDYSDFPNFSVLNGTITDVKKKSNNIFEIYLNKALDQDVKEGTPIRIQSPVGAKYVIVNIGTLQPGEDVLFRKTIKKDDLILSFSQNAFCKGTYSVRPIVIFRALSNSEENTSVIINKYSISYWSD